MADYDFPADLVDLQREFFRLEAVGEVTAELTDTAVRLSGHEWWGTCGDRFKARQALRKLVQEQNPVPPAN